MTLDGIKLLRVRGYRGVYIVKVFLHLIHLIRSCNNLGQRTD